jgi:extradiol dioxygenase family protein
MRSILPDNACRTKVVYWQYMSVKLNHTIVAAKDKSESATFLTELFDLPDAQPFGHFLVVNVANDVSLDYAQVPDGEDVRPQHYAFLVSEDEFGSIYRKISDRGIPHWADPRQSRPGEINHNDGGRGVYFQDPSGHYLEILTRPYGSGA